MSWHCSLILAGFACILIELVSESGNLIVSIWFFFNFFCVCESITLNSGKVFAFKLHRSGQTTIRLTKIKWNRKDASAPKNFRLFGIKSKSKSKSNTKFDVNLLLEVDCTSKTAGRFFDAYIRWLLCS